jgi:cytochrome c biogenesis protein CcmG, thiol:disulfide interchange protein DsbE
VRRAWRAAPPAARWAAAAALVIAAFAVAELASGHGDDTTVGRAAPPLPTKALRPPGVDLAALRGKPALVDFFASWCGPCAEEAPTLRELSAAMGAKATVVAVDWDDEDSAARAFVRKNRWTFPVLSDANGSVGESYGVNVGLPTSFVLDPAGRIVETFRGPQSVATLRRALLEAT